MHWTQKNFTNYTYFEEKNQYIPGELYSCETFNNTVFESSQPRNIYDAIYLFQLSLIITS